MFSQSKFPTFRRVLPVIIPAGVVLCLTVVVTIFFFLHSRQLMERQLRQQLVSAAQLAARQFDGIDFSGIRTEADMQRQDFIDIVHKLERTQENIPNALFVYLMRKTDEPEVLEFIADGDALFSDEQLDDDGDGIVGADEAPATPGFPYNIAEFPSMQSAFMYPSVDSDITTDQWGSYISAYAPIYDDRGKVTAIFGVDIDAETFFELSTIIITPELLILLSVGGLLLALYIGYYLWLWRMALQNRLSDERFALINLAMHQIGAPLAAFRWWLDLLRESYTSPSKKDECQVAYERLDESIGRMTDVITALKQASIVHDGHMSYKSEIVSFATIAHRVEAELEAELKQHAHTLTFDIPDDVTSRMDRKLIAGVLHELITNAISYSPQKSTTTVKARKHGKYIEVSVVDTGFGMSDEDLQYVFEPFRRGKDAGKYRPVGNGMGLFLAKRIVEIGGGQFAIESKISKGTMVSFTLPLE